MPNVQGLKNDYLHTVCHNPTLACKRYSLGRRFWKPKDPENTRVNGLTSLVANTILGVISQPHFKIVRKYNGSIKI